MCSGVVMDTWLAIETGGDWRQSRGMRLVMYCLRGKNKKPGVNRCLLSFPCGRRLWLNQWRMAWGQIKQQVDHRHFTELIPQNSLPTFILKCLCHCFNVNMWGFILGLQLFPLPIKFVRCQEIGRDAHHSYPELQDVFRWLNTTVQNPKMFSLLSENRETTWKMT